MRICRKCNSQVDGTGKICRACGGILEEVAAPEPAPELGSQVGDEEMSSTPADSVTEPVAEPLELEIEEASDADGISPGPTWTCQNCGEVVPGNFNTCWKCLTTRTGKPTPDAKQLLSEVGENDEHADPDNSESDTEVLKETDANDVALTQCPKCGSTKIIQNATISHQDEDFKAVVSGNPEALFFKNCLHGEIRTDICGNCGHIAFRVANPGELYDHYRKTQGCNVLSTPSHCLRLLA